MCEKAVDASLSALEYVLDWSRMPEIVDNSGLDNLITNYKGYKQHKGFKREIDRVLMPVAWNPLKWWNWSMPKDERTVVVVWLAAICEIFFRINI